MTRKFDLLIIDSYFPECVLGLVPVLKVPFMFLNTMTNYLATVAFTGTPVPWAVSPAFLLPHTDHMTFRQRLQNGFSLFGLDLLHRVRGKG